MYHQLTFRLLLFAIGINTQITGDNGWLQNDASQYTFGAAINALPLVSEE